MVGPGTPPYSFPVKAQPPVEGMTQFLVAERGERPIPSCSLTPSLPAHRESHRLQAIALAFRAFSQLMPPSRPLTPNPRPSSVPLSPALPQESANAARARLYFSETSTASSRNLRLSTTSASHSGSTTAIKVFPW